MSSQSRPRRSSGVIAGVVALALLATSAGTADAARGRSTDPTWRTRALPPSERLIVRFDPAVGSSARREIAAAAGLERVAAIRSFGIEVFDLPAGGRARALEALSRRGGVLEVAPDERVQLLGDPSGESRFAEQWGLHNTGQRIRGYDGVANIDIDGLQALTAVSGDPSVVVAVIDDGVDFSHPDLAGSAWVNPGESGVDGDGNDRATNGIDDDGNGYVDDVHGWDWCAGSGDVYQSGESHGTHVAGTIAAALDGQGVVGVAPGVRIMALRFLCGNMGGSTSDAIEALAYAKSFGVRISNNSWGGGGYNGPLASAIAQSGMLFVAAAGNGGLDQLGDDNDATPVYPASYPAPNIVAVSAIHNEGALSSFSNWGKTSVDISAPGEDILSTLPPRTGCPAPCYGYASGTSMAAPHVTGVAALVASVKPSMLDDPIALKQHLLATGKSLPSTKGKTASGRLVDAWRAIDLAAPTVSAPTRHAFVGNTVLGSSVTMRVSWPTASDDLSGVASYAVQHQVNGGSWVTITSSTTATTLDRSVVPGKTYRYRVRARDRAGNASALVPGAVVQPKLVQESSTSITFAGSWATASQSGASGGKVRYASKAGASATFSFTGRAIALVAPKGPTRGTVKVYIDDVYVKTIDLYRSSTRSKVLVFTKAWDSAGSHTIRLVVVGKSGRPRVDIDAFLVLK